MAASNNRGHPTRSLYFACSRHIHVFLFFTHIPFVLNHTINATPPERFQQHPLLFTMNHTDRTFFVWRLNLAQPPHPGHSTILLRSEIPSVTSANGIMTKLTYIFSVILIQLRSVTEKSPPKRDVETQSREMFLVFRTTPLVVHCMAAASLVAAAMFFNELIQFVEDGLSSWANSNVKTAQLDNGFCFLIGNPTTQNQLNLFWNICCFIELNTKQLSFC